MPRPVPTLRAAAFGAALAFALATAQASGPGGKPEMSPEATPVEHRKDVFGPDPSYENKPYSEEDQLRIYGGKFSVQTPRPLLEAGREIYRSGPLSAPGHGWGRKNPTDQSFTVYGDWRAAFARNDNGARSQSVLATRLNLEADWKLTATERVHAFFRPLDHGGNFTGCASPAAAGTRRCNTRMDVKADALFFEGDLGAMIAGWTDRYQSFDLPITFGKIPLLFQNGVWLEDAFTGLAFSIPARNSRLFDISNMDVTFFAGLDNVNTPGIVDRSGQPNGSNRLLGMTAFLEANEGYWELGLAHVRPKDNFADQGYNNAAVSFTKRYFDRISNSMRVIHNFGQRPNAGVQRNADGTLLLIENSLVTHKPLTLVPYFNVFYGHKSTQSVARAVDAGGILKNTGINFETDGLTGFAKLDDTGRNAYGGALGLQYLFDLQQQVVVELANVRPHGNAANRFIPGQQTALGLRYQRALDKAWIFRADAIVANRTNAADLAGIRFEIRRKF